VGEAARWLPTHRTPVLIAVAFMSLLSLVPTAAAGTREDPDLVDPAGDGTRNDVIAAWFTYDEPSDRLYLDIQFAAPPLEPHQCKNEPDEFRESHYISFHFHVYDETLKELSAKEADQNLTWFRFVTNRICESTSPAAPTGRTFTNVGLTNENRTRFNVLGRTNQTIRGDVMTVQIDPKTLRLPFNSFLPDYRVTNLTLDTEFAGLLTESSDDKAPDMGFGRNFTIGQRPGSGATDVAGKRPPRALAAEQEQGRGAPGVLPMVAALAVAAVAIADRRRRV
jgi:hypothetical protein